MISTIMPRLPRWVPRLLARLLKASMRVAVPRRDGALWAALDRWLFEETFQ